MKAERAKIFAPYDALRGMYRQLHQMENIRVEKAELSEDELEYLNRFFSNLHEGRRISLSYYDDNSGAYLSAMGTVDSFSADKKKIRLIPDESPIMSLNCTSGKVITEIAFSDIHDVRFIE